jgi:hypothetical protein
MGERIDAWYISVLPKIGMLDDAWAHGWVYLAVVKPSGSAEQGILYDIAPDSANTRKEAIDSGRRRWATDSDAVMLEDWAYTSDEAQHLEFNSFWGGTISAEQTGCGGCEE